MCDGVDIEDSVRKRKCRGCTMIVDLTNAILGHLVSYNEPIFVLNRYHQT